ncbi:MAG: tetratricopeptide repeat protein [Hydrogenovibrio sp.]
MKHDSTHLRKRPGALLTTLLWTWGIIAPLTMFAETAAADEQAYQARFEQAIQASQSGDMDGAIQLLQGLLKDYPQDLAASNNLAAAYIKQHEYDKAQQVLESALNADPKIAALRKNLNQIYAYQAQQAYQSVFKKSEVDLPQGQWILSAGTELKTPEQAQLALVENNMKRVANRVESWRQAWVEQEVSRYLDYYSPDYTSDNYNNHQAWAKSRDRSLTRPSYIRIQLDDVQVVPLTPQTIQVTFWQAYESNTFKDRVRKKLVWQNQDDQWKIVQENVLYD